jgi:PAS domain S-box-containing protein
VRSIIENSPDGIFLIDENATIIEWNKAQEKITGIKKRNIIGTSAWNIIDKLNFVEEKAMQGFVEKIKDFTQEGVISKKSVSIYDEFLIRKKNKEIYISSLNFSIPVKKATYFASFNKDITNQKKAEKDIIFTLQKEKELNLLRSQFISTVSHEFRTPLANISSNTQLLDRFFDKWNREKSNTNFNRIYESVKDISSMLEDISLLGKEQSGRLKYHPSKVNIIPFCSKVIQESKEVIKNDVNVRFVNNLKESTVILDKNLLRQILNNVITNAMKYSQSRKEVIFEITQEENEFVKFIVTDNGIGIPKDDLKNIFEPFQRASNVEKYKGSGLGLSIVKKFVDLHNGTIQIKSELKKGTIVTIKIPLVVQEN